LRNETSRTSQTSDHACGFEYRRRASLAGTQIPSAT
jgi:hypothetical protein